MIVKMIQNLENKMETQINSLETRIEKIQERFNKDGEGNGNPLQYSCLANPMDGGARLATVHGVAKSPTRLSDFTITIHYLSSTSLILSSASVILLLFPSRVFFISFIALFIIE